MNSDQNHIGISNGSVVQARAMVRLVPSARWDYDRISKIQGIPTMEKVRAADHIEEEIEPHKNLDDDLADVDEQGLPRRLTITMADLRAHGFSEHCMKCQMHSQGNHARGLLLRHSEDCRARIYKAMRDAGVEKFQRTEDK